MTTAGSLRECTSSTVASGDYGRIRVRAHDVNHKIVPYKAGRLKATGATGDDAGLLCDTDNGVSTRDGTKNVYAFPYVSYQVPSCGPDRYQVEGWGSFYNGKGKPLRTSALVDSPFVYLSGD